MKSTSILATAFVLLAPIACAHASKTPPNVMDSMWCDTEPMKPRGHVSRIPAVAPSADLGTLTGVVIQRETGDALVAAAVRLVPVAGSSGQPYSERQTGDDGGFSFEGVAPGRYQIRVRRINEYQDSTAFEAVSGRVDTVTIAMRAYRCRGY
jgi:hypothetical protein